MRMFVTPAGTTRGAGRVEAGVAGPGVAAGRERGAPVETGRGGGAGAGTGRGGAGVETGRGARGRGAGAGTGGGRRGRRRVASRSRTSRWSTRTSPRLVKTTRG